jgi:very-short-patch-repair endonuclease
VTHEVGDTPSLRPCEVLVAVINQRSDFEILSRERWYRIPTDVARGRWRPEWLALYQTAEFGPEGKAVNYYARVENISEASRRDLFPGKPIDAKAWRRYYKLQLGPLIPLEMPIPLLRPRPIAFIPSTLDKLMTATQINDLWHVSPLEDRLWQELKRLEIDAERQYDLPVANTEYRLDFAVFCNKGNLDIETDGDSYHIGLEKGQRDNERNNAVAGAGWEVLRFTTAHIREEMAEYCVPTVRRTLNRLGGLRSESTAPRKFLDLPEGDAQQLGLFD